MGVVVRPHDSFYNEMNLSNNLSRKIDIFTLSISTRESGV